VSPGLAVGDAARWAGVTPARRPDTGHAGRLGARRSEPDYPVTYRCSRPIREAVGVTHPYPAAHHQPVPTTPNPVPHPAPTPTGRIRRPDPATPYHRLARTSAHRWWRPLLGTLLVALGAGIAMAALVAAWAVVGYATGRPLDADDFPTFGPIVDTALELLAVAPLIPLVLLTARWIQARPAGTVSSVNGRLRWRWLGTCLLVALPTVVLMLAGIAGLLAAAGEPILTGNEHRVDTGTFLASAVMLLALVPIQAAAEEYAFRGWLLQAVGAFVRTPWPGIMTQAAIFAALHGWGTPWGFTDLFLFGAVAAWLTIRTGGLEAAIALHTVNNLVAMLLTTTLGALATDGTAADATWQILLADTITIGAYTAAVTWLARRRRIDQTVPAAASTAPPSSTPSSMTPDTGSKVL
jgi:membrane protease YdiL (CAAX protease family)